MADGPRAGIKVLEVSQIIAEPFCGINLADLGAAVVKLEPPGGEGGPRPRRVHARRKQVLHGAERRHHH